MHAEALSPEVVLLGSLGQGSASFGGKFLGHGADVVRFKATAAADVAHSHLVSFASVALDVPAGTHARL